MTTKLLDQTDSRALSEVSTIALAAVLGLGLIFAAGFSHAGGMHDVAHDARHATGFPCH